MVKPLGASLYVPANHKNLSRIANGDKLEQARSLIFCLEDAVGERDLSWALFNLSVVLAHMRPQAAAERFVRVRNPEVLARVLAMPGAEKLDGFVLPKVTRHNFETYFRLVRDTGHDLMITEPQGGRTPRPIRVSQASKGGYTRPQGGRDEQHVSPRRGGQGHGQ